MIFDLLNYPQTNGNLTQSQVKENFDLAYNVLKCSQMYIENPELHFLNEETEKQGIIPDQLAHSRFLVEFLIGLQSIAFCKKPHSKIQN